MWDSLTGSVMDNSKRKVGADALPYPQQVLLRCFAMSQNVLPPRPAPYRCCCAAATHLWTHWRARRGASWTHGERISGVGCVLACACFVGTSQPAASWMPDEPVYALLFGRCSEGLREVGRRAACCGFQSHKQRLLATLAAPQLRV